MVPGRSQEWQIMLRCQNSWVLYFPNRIYNRTCLYPLACCITQEFPISRESSPKIIHHYTAQCYPIRHKIVLFFWEIRHISYSHWSRPIESYVEITWHYTTLRRQNTKMLTTKVFAETVLPYKFMIMLLCGKVLKRFLKAYLAIVLSIQYAAYPARMMPNSRM